MSRSRDRHVLALTLSAVALGTAAIVAVPAVLPGLQPVGEARAETASPQRFGLGRDALPEEVQAWDIDVRPDGLGLPEGSGSVADGETVYTENCAVCHGDFGEAVGRWPVLAGGQGTLTDADPNKTIGSYWPYLSTVYDYVRRAMPFGNAQSLSTDQVYAIVAYLLYLNDLVDDDFVLSKENFTEVRLPNEPNFYDDDRVTVEFPRFVRESCMTDCKPSVEITARAMVLDVTPEDSTDPAGEGGEAAEPPAGDPSTEAALPAEAPVEVAAVEAAEPAEAAPDPALVAAGETAFKQCSACHQIGEGARNRTGPQLNGVVGRAAGQAKGFRYSKALTSKAEAGLVWNDETLHALLVKPRDFIPGTKMAFAGMRDEDDVTAVIAYLKTFRN